MSSSAARNILFLMTDQHRVDTLGFYGGVPSHTPVLNNLADRSKVYDAAYTPSAICTPARASLLTGLHPFEHGLLSNYEWNSGHREELQEGLPTFSSALADQGFRLGHVGKWHVGRHRGPEYYGFDGEHIAGALNNYSHPGYVAWLEDHGYPPVSVTDAIYTTLPDGSQGHLIAGQLDQPTEATFEAYLADVTISMIRRYATAQEEDGRPFFLACHFFGPHLPYLLPAEWLDLHDPEEIDLPRSMAETFEGKPDVQRTYSQYWGVDGFTTAEWCRITAIYRGYVAMIDHQIGRILDALEEYGQTQKTVVAFTADHGEFTGAHRLNDKGPAMYEDIYRIPALLHVPGEPAKRVGDFVTLLDFHATILDVAGAARETSRGASLLRPAEFAGRSDVFAEFHGHHFAYAQRMIRDRRHKLIVNPEGRTELYDMIEDPDELINVIDVPVYAEVADDLRRRLYRELVARGDRFAQWIAMTQGIEPSERIRPETAVENFTS
ncbi:sulfatase-like hydrolase/transferase [Georgenia subflava]|uniref:Sulfatase-like hydrolase/transferase n=1 Tax=Georgenia subflava TaxID=1622177 RepID=A0A6N7EIY7_9MICO|nr:sulfatase-like hydrolase/transferase [Georgenia subflava]MPV36697.1 sulfatase-like hydrolase/transferase [Georgenia subflava]